MRSASRPIGATRSTAETETPAPRPPSGAWRARPRRSATLRCAGRSRSFRRAVVSPAGARADHSDPSVPRARGGAEDRCGLREASGLGRVVWRERAATRVVGVGAPQHRGCPLASRRQASHRMGIGGLELARVERSIHEELRSERLDRLDVAPAGVWVRVRDPADALLRGAHAPRRNEHEREEPCGEVHAEHAGSGAYSRRSG
jgi:hypothetical protein